MKSQSSRKERRGAAAIEFAVVLPVFVLILLGTLETCTMIFLQQSLEIAAYEGARITIIPKTDMLDIQTAVGEILTARRVKDATIVVTPSDFQNAPYGTFIKVDVSVPCNSNAVIPLSYFGMKSLTGTVEMMKEF